VGKLVSADGKAAAIVLHYAGGDRNRGGDFTTSLRVKEAAEKVLKGTDTSGRFRIYFGGMPFMVFNMTLLITSNLTYLLPLLLLVLISVLYFSFRHWAGVVFPLLVVVVTDIWIAGIMSLLGLKFDLLTGIVPVILLALGSADGIHLLKRYFERRQLGNSADEASRKIFKEMGTPIVLTTITTMVGFASLVISDFSVIQQFGLMTALGVFLALVVTLTLLPALLSLGVTPARKRGREVDSGGILDVLAGWVYTHRRTVLVTAAAVIALAFTGAPRLFKDVDWTLCLQKGSSPYHAEMLLRQKFGGSLPVQVLVQGDVKDPAVLHLVRKVERKLNTVPLVNHAESVAGVIAEMNGVLNGWKTVPEGRQAVENLWFLIENEEFLSRIVGENGREALIQARLATWHTSSLVRAVDSLQAYLRKLPKRIAVIALDSLNWREKTVLWKRRAADLRIQLQWVLKGFGVRLPGAAANRAVAALENFRVSSAVKTAVQKKVQEYLISPEAEVELDAWQARKIATTLTQEVNTEQKNLVHRVGRVLRRLLSRVPSEDREDLAISLAEIVRNTVDSARVEFALQRVLAELPDTFRNGAEQIEELKGVLWLANQRYVFLPAEEAQRLLGDDHPAVVRQVEWRATQAGMAPLLKRMEEELTPTQIESLLLTMVFILILLTLIFRSPLGSLIAVVPISITILVNFAVMGYLRIGLDSFTAMIASIAIGLGIDTDIHFISRLRDELRQDGVPLAALQRTFRSTGMSILVNALAVGLGFLVLLAAGGQHIRRFGGLTAMTILLSALFTLTILPSLFLLLKPRFLRNAMEEGSKRRAS
jgi:predicted RND superfamily exporter protein